MTPTGETVRPPFPASFSTPEPNAEPTLDSQINHATSISYWSNTPATVNGMLGGYPHISRIDLQGSKSFIRKIQRLSRTTENTSIASTSNDAVVQDSKPKKLRRVLDCGAGIGRITSGLLVNVAEVVDIVEPVAKFAQVMIDSELRKDGQVGDVFMQGLESFTPPPERKYDIIWNQWCLGHLTDKQVVEWLKRSASCLQGHDDHAGECPLVRGWILVKENLCTDTFGEDVFDPVDSSVTRSDESFRRLFEEAGLRIVRMELQSGFPKSLYPVKMYGLRPK